MPEIDSTIWIYEYLNEIEAGRIDAPKRVIKQYEKLIPIIDGHDSRYGYSPKAAYAPIYFAEKYCRQSKDEWCGQPIQFLLWQKACLSALYGILDRETHYRKFQKLFLLVGKKNGKSTMIAPIALYETAKPGNEVIAAANALQQSKIVWTEAANMLAQSPMLKDTLKKRQFDIINSKEGKFSRFLPVANKPNFLDGKLPKVIILDEVHELHQDIYDILHNGQISVKDPLLLMLTTKGYVHPGLFDTEYEESKNIVDGIIEDEHKFSLLYELDDPVHWEDDTKWEQPNPSLGYILTVDKLRESVAEARRKSDAMNAVKTKHFNIDGTTNDAFFQFEEVINEATFDMERLRGMDVIGGFDLSRTSDMTAFSTVAFDKDTGDFLCDTMYWVTEDFFTEATQDSRMAATWRTWVDKGLVRVAGKHIIEYSDLVRYALEMVNKYDLYYRWIYYDPYSAQYLVKDFNDAGFREDDCLIKAHQGAKTLSVPFQTLAAKVRGKKINYNNNPVMKWNMMNVGTRGDTNENEIPKKAGNKNMRKIDGFATLLDCFVGYVEHAQELGVNMT